MPRFKVDGIRQSAWGDEPATLYLDATDRDDALRRCGLLDCTSIVEVPASEGRGILYRLLKSARKLCAFLLE